MDQDFKKYKLLDLKILSSKEVIFMKRKIFLLFVILIGFIVFARGKYFSDISSYYLKNLPKQNLSNYEIQALIKMRKEEKLARDVYIRLGKKFNLFVFRNISNSPTATYECYKSYFG